MTTQINHIGRAFCAVLLTSALSAQCTNIVPNGDFESFFPAWTVVDGTGTATFPTTDVNGLGATRALQLTAGRRSSVTVELTQAFALDSTSRYVVTADVLSDGLGQGNRIALSVVDAAGQSTPVEIGAIGSGSSGKSRLSAVVDPGAVPVSGDYRIRVAYARGPFTFASFAVIDNIAMRADDTPTFTLTSTARTVNTDVSWSLIARPFQVVMVTLSVEGIGTGSPIPTCGANPLFLLPSTPPLLVFDPVFLNSTGQETGAFPVPADVAGVPFRWQASGLPIGGQACIVGCPEIIAF